MRTFSDFFFDKNKNQKMINRTLLKACKIGDTKLVVSLLSKNNVDPNFQEEQTGTTPLILACKNGHLGVVSLLLEKNVNINTQENYGDTALIKACRCRHKDIVSLLLEKNANPDIRDVDGITALIYACNRGFKDIISLLLEKNADINIEDKGGKTALFFASKNRYDDIIFLLKLSKYKKESLPKKILLLCCREYCEDSVFFKDFLPLDIFRYIFDIYREDFFLD